MIRSILESLVSDSFKFPSDADLERLFISFKAFSKRTVFPASQAFIPMPVAT
jgi:hypothetical protein